MLFDFAQTRLHITARRQYDDVAADVALMAAKPLDYNHLFEPDLQSPKLRKQNLTPPQIHSASSRKVEKGNLGNQKKSLCARL